VRALEGVRIVVTRASHQAEELARPLRELGAQVTLLPMIAIAPPADLEPLRQAAARCDEYDWIIFTSANAVPILSAELPHAPNDCKARIAAVGAATRETAQQAGFQVSLIPEKYVAESLIETFAGQDLTGRRILIPSAAVTREIIPAELKKRGAKVDVVEAYRTITPPDAEQHAAIVFHELDPEWITFASPSAVENLVRLIGAESLRRLKIATIGPITSAAVRKYNLNVATEAAAQSVTGLVEALCAAQNCAAKRL